MPHFPPSTSWVKGLERRKTMLQSFQCTSCGHLNVFGEPVCTQCGQPFIYNCPICGCHINNRYNKCRGCGAIFNWGVPMQQPLASAVAAYTQDRLNIYPQNQEQTPSTLVLPTDAAQRPSATAGQLRKSFQPSDEKSAAFYSTPRFWIILIIICVALIVLLLAIDMFISK